MRKYQSRLAKNEEKTNKKKAYLYLTLTIVCLGFLLFFGIPAIIKMASFLADIRSSNEPVNQEDTTPPAPPTLDNLPEATNKTSITITGSAEPGSTVILYVNSEKSETITDNSGEFSYTTEILDGENTIYGVTKDPAGNESQSTEEYKLVYDDELPELEIKSPSDGAEFYGSKQRQVSIEGITEIGAKLTINDRVVVVEDDGTFIFATTLQEGDNSFVLKSEDKATNITEKTMTLKFSE